MDSNIDESWHLSKSVPLTLIFAIACQTVALIWFVAQMSSDVEETKRDLIRLETRTNSLENVVQSQAVTLGRMDENIKSIREAVERMANGK